MTDKWKDIEGSTELKVACVQRLNGEWVNAVPEEEYRSWQKGSFCCMVIFIVVSVIAAACA